MMDPGMQAAGMPPMGPPQGDPSMMGAAPMAPPSPIDAVMAALQGLQMQRQTEDDAVLAAVMKATGQGLPPGMMGVSEGAQFGAPNPDAAGDAGMGMNPDAAGDTGMGGY